MATLDEIMAKASPVERIVRVCVAGALAGEYESVKDQLESLPIVGARLSGGYSEEHEKLSARKGTLEKEMSEATFEFRFRALSPKGWSDLVAAHPDPAGFRNFNVETFPAAAIAACCIDPEGLNDIDACNNFLSNLSPAQQSELFDAAWEANVTAPKGLISSSASDDPQGSEKS